MASSQRVVAPGQGRSDPNLIAPFLTHVVSHHGQLTLIPPQNAGRIRKGAKSKHSKLERRREPDEPRFNTAAPISRGTSRRGNNPERRARQAPTSPRFPRDTVIPDYPPPSFQEALMSPPPFITIADGETPVPFPPLPPSLPSQTLAPATYETSSPQILSAAGTTTETTVSPSSIQGSPPASPNLPLPADDPELASRALSSVSQLAEMTSDVSPLEDDDDLEIVGLEPLEGPSREEWEIDRRAGLPLESRIQREFTRQLVAESTTTLVPISETSVPPVPPLPPKTPERCKGCGSHLTVDTQGSPRSPAFSSKSSSPREKRDGSPPGSPKGHGGWKKMLQPVKTIHDDFSTTSTSQSLSPRSPTYSLFTPWASTLNLSTQGSSKPSPSPPFTRHKNKSVRRLFSTKGKEREDVSDKGSPPSSDGADELESWEVVEKEPLFIDEIPPHSQTGTQDALPLAKGTPSIHDMPETPTRAQTHPAFLSRPVRPSGLSYPPMFSANPSIMSLPAALVGGSSTSRDVFSQPPGKARSVLESPLGTTKRTPVPPRKKAVSSFRSSPSVVWLSMNDNPSSDSSSRISPPSSSPWPRRPVPSPLHSPLCQTSAAVSEPLPIADDDSIIEPESDSLSIIVPERLDSAIPSPTPTTSSITASTPSETEYSVTLFPATPTTPQPTTPPTTPPPSLSLPLPTTPPSDSPPRTPTTPSHHYPGRPLPQVPRHPSPLRSVVAPPVISPTPSIQPSVISLGMGGVGYSQLTDLDALASRVTAGANDGHSYEDLLLLSEVIGPAHPLPSTNLSLPPKYTMPAVARIEVQRRRVMKDGRVKLKLTLMGVTVDKCAICLSQFKDKEVAALGPSCQHAFHEYCLTRWLATGSRACPLCRASLL